MRTSVISLIALVVLVTGGPARGMEGRGNVDTTVVLPKPLLVAEVTTDKPQYDPGDTVHIMLTVWNFGDEEVKLTFPTSLQMDYILDGAYRWSKGKVFLQVITHVAIPPGGSHTWKLAHDPSEFPLRQGVHWVWAFLTKHEILRGRAMFVVGEAVILEGRVLDEDGGPVQEAVVSVGHLPTYYWISKEELPPDMRFPWPARMMAVTDQEGRFRIDGLVLEDTLKVRAWKFGYVQAETTVVMDEETVYLELTLKRLKTGVLAGKVYGEGGVPLEGATVTVFQRWWVPELPILERENEVSSKSFLRPPSVRTDEEGRFYIGGIFVGGTVRVSARKEGYENVGREVTVGEDTTWADFYLPEVDTTSANRLRRIEDGIFFGLGLDKFLYGPEDTLRARYRVMNTGVEPVDVPFPTGQHVEFVVRTSDGREVWRWSKGRVFTQMGSSLHLEPGKLYAFEAEVPLGSLKGDAFTLEAYQPSSDEEWGRRSSVAAKFLVYPVPQAGALLRGRVFGGDEPLVGAFVVVRPSAIVLKGDMGTEVQVSWPTERFATFTDEKGYFQVEGLRRFGTYDVAAAAEGYWPQVEVVYAAQETLYVEFHLKPAEGVVPVLRKVEGGVCVEVDLPYPGEVQIKEVDEELPKWEGHRILKLLRVRMDRALAVFRERVRVAVSFDPRVLRRMGIGSDALRLGFWNGEEWKPVPCRVDSEENLVSGEVPPNVPVALFAAVPEPYVQEEPGSKPKAFRLFQNFPNPFNTVTTIRFSLPEARAGTVAKLEVLDLTGRRVRVLLDREMPTGSYRVLWDGRDDAGRPAASGIYLYRLTYGAYRAVRRMVYIR